MNFFLCSMLYSQTHGFLHGNLFISRPYVKPLFNSHNNLYQIKPLNTIVHYNLEYETKLKIQNEINNKTNNKYIMNTDNIYIAFYDYSDKDNENKSKCQVFVNVHDIENNLDGQYILETIEYKKIYEQGILFSFYENNKNFYTSFSCYRNFLDEMNYMSDLKFDFIYEHNQPYLKNIASNQKPYYTPSFIYSSELKYKNVLWKKSSKIIYYKNSFYYKIIT